MYSPRLISSPRATPSFNQHGRVVSLLSESQLVPLRTRYAKTSYGELPGWRLLSPSDQSNKSINLTASNPHSLKVNSERTRTAPNKAITQHAGRPIPIAIRTDSPREWMILSPTELKLAVEERKRLDKIYLPCSWVQRNMSTVPRLHLHSRGLDNALPMLSPPPQVESSPRQAEQRNIESPSELLIVEEMPQIPETEEQSFVYSHSEASSEVESRTLSVLKSPNRLPPMSSVQESAPWQIKTQFEVQTKTLTPLERLRSASPTEIMRARNAAKAQSSSIRTIEVTVSPHKALGTESQVIEDFPDSPLIPEQQDTLKSTGSDLLIPEIHFEHRVTTAPEANTTQGLSERHEVFRELFEGRTATRSQSYSPGLKAEDVTSLFDVFILKLRRGSIKSREQAVSFIKDELKDFLVSDFGRGQTSRESTRPSYYLHGETVSSRQASPALDSTRFGPRRRARNLSWTSQMGEMTDRLRTPRLIQSNQLHIRPRFADLSNVAVKFPEEIEDFAIGKWRSLDETTKGKEDMMTSEEKETAEINGELSPHGEQKSDSRVVEKAKKEDPNHPIKRRTRTQDTFTPIQESTPFSEQEPETLTTPQVNKEAKSSTKGLKRSSTMKPKKAKSSSSKSSKSKPGKKGSGGKTSTSSPSPSAIGHNSGVSSPTLGSTELLQLPVSGDASPGSPGSSSDQEPAMTKVPEPVQEVDTEQSDEEEESEHELVALAQNRRFSMPMILKHFLPPHGTDPQQHRASVYVSTVITDPILLSHANRPKPHTMLFVPESETGRGKQQVEKGAASPNERQKKKYEFHINDPFDQFVLNVAGSLLTSLELLEIHKTKGEVEQTKDRIMLNERRNITKTAASRKRSPASSNEEAPAAVAGAVAALPSPLSLATSPVAVQITPSLSTKPETRRSSILVKILPPAPVGVKTDLVSEAPAELVGEKPVASTLVKLPEVPPRAASPDSKKRGAVKKKPKLRRRRGSHQAADSDEEEDQELVELIAHDHNFVSTNIDFELKQIELVKKLAALKDVQNDGIQSKFASVVNVDDTTTNKEIKEAETHRVGKKIDFGQSWLDEVPPSEIPMDVEAQLANWTKDRALKTFPFSVPVTFDMAKLTNQASIQDTGPLNPDLLPNLQLREEERLRRRFQTMCRNQPTHGDLIAKDDGVLHMADKDSFYPPEIKKEVREAVNKRRHREKVLKDREGQTYVKLRAAPTKTFTNLPVTLKSSRPKTVSQNVFLDGFATSVKTEQEYKERIYLRIKKETNLRRLNVASPTWGTFSLGATVRELHSLTTRPRTQR